MENDPIGNPFSDDPKSDVFERIDLGQKAEVLYRADAGRVFRLFSEHQFDDPFLAFRELYANALDACRGVASARIEIEVRADRVVIEDSGSGLDEESIAALTTLGGSTRRGSEYIGRFGIGFTAIFEPSLGVEKVDFLATLRGQVMGHRLRFTRGEAGEVAIESRAAAPPRLGGSRVTIYFDPKKAPADRQRTINQVLKTHGSYSGTTTILNGVQLGRELSDYIKDVVRDGVFSNEEKELIAVTAVQGAVGVAAIDPSRSASSFRAYQHGLFVTELELQKEHGRPWPRGVFGAVFAEGLELVTSRNDFVRNDDFHRFQIELRQLAFEAAYRIVRHFEVKKNAYSRIVLLDAIRRGLRLAAPEELLAKGSDLFSSALVRSPLFRAWGERRAYSFEELVSLREQGTLVALPYRPYRIARDVPCMRSDLAIERDIFRHFIGLREMPALARAESISTPSFWSRIKDRLVSGPRAEYSLFQRTVRPVEVSDEARLVVEALSDFLAAPEVASALAKILPGPIPRLGIGWSKNAFGPVAAYRGGEIRFNVVHRRFRRLARKVSPESAARALLPVLAHELAHMCHELHDIDFYRTSRILLRSLATAAIEIDRQNLASA